MSTRTRRRPLGGLAAAALLIGLTSACAADAGDDASSSTESSTESSTDSRPASDSADGTDAVPSVTAATTKAPPRPDGATTPAAGSLYAPGDVDPGLQPWIDDATDDLAERLGVGVSDVTTVAAVLVTWPDSSLGCPRPGMEYLQVLTDGAVIELEAGGDVYRYHAGDGSGPFLCPTPITSAPVPAG